MTKTFRTYVPEQNLLLPASLRDWLPDDHLCYFVSDVVDQLDLSAIESVYEEEDRGQPPYHPRMMVKILVYGYCVGVFSSRRIQKRMVEDVAFRVLGAGNQPDFRTISDFRKLHLKALEELFQQMLRLTLETGTMKLGRVALDGSKVKGNASKHKAMSYGRMQETEKRLREEVRKLMKQAEAADKEEDSRYGRDRRGDELPEELQRRETRIARIREAKQALEERAREQAKSEGKDPEQAEPTQKAQYNFTDPESRILKGPDGFVQGYNTQIAVEPVFQLIVGQRVTQAANDKQQMVPLIEAIEEQSGQKPAGVLADSGYCSDENLKYLARKRMEGFVATVKLPANKFDPTLFTPEERKVLEMQGENGFFWGVPWGVGPRRPGADKYGNYVYVPGWWSDTLMQIDIHSLKVNEYPMPTKYAGPYMAQVDKYHQVWVNFQNSGTISKFDPDSKKWTEYNVPTPSCDTHQIGILDHDGPTQIAVACIRDSKVMKFQFRTKEQVAALRAEVNETASNR